MTDTYPDHLFSDPELAQLYDHVGGERPDFEFCRELAQTAKTVLDLGCGTGALAVSLADPRSQGFRITGVDPAKAMLDLAEVRPGGGVVDWVLGDARNIRLGKKFDLVVLTGHTFQFFLSDDDQQMALATIAAHLAPGGQFVFDSRNPLDRPWEGKSKASTLRRFDHPEHGAMEGWSEPHFDDKTGLLNSVNSYRFIASGKIVSAPLTLRFTLQNDLATKVEAAGLTVTSWLGDWQGEAFHPDAKEIIALGGLAV